MPIPSRQTGWSTQDNLLWQIAKQMEQTECQLCTLNDNIQAITGTSGSSGSSGSSGTNGSSGSSGVSGASGLYYGSFYDETDQTGARSTLLLMKFGNTDLSNGVSITNDGFGNPTQITIANAGKYNIQFSAQMVSTTGNSSTRAEIWLRKNGSNVPATTTWISFPGNSVYIVAAWNFLVDASAGDNFQLAWAINSNVDNAVTLAHEAGTALYPSVPSVILTVTQIG